MSKIWIALSIWFLFLIPGLMLAVWLHKMEHPDPGWRSGFIATIKEKISAFAKKLSSKTKRSKKK